MSYQVNFTDSDNKSPITVFDNTSSEDTSLTFPGRNVTGYGQIIAENFLSLLENFASATEPVNPVEGQLWYDSTNGVLQIWDNTNWKAASGIQKGPTEPSVRDSKIGELWVDTTNQQLRIYSGTRWILVGPSESSIDGLRYGPAVETITDSSNIDRTILIFYLKDIPIVVVSKDSFTPKITIAGYPAIKSGINIYAQTPGTESAEFIGGLIPKLYSTAANADALNVLGVEIPAGKFLRSDIVNTTDQGFNVKNNSGITLGTDGTFNLSTSSTAARIYNSAVGSSLDLQTNRNGIPSTILRVFDNKVGINKASPDYELDVDGIIRVSGSLIVADVTESTNLNNGSIRTAGGMAIAKNLLVGTGLDVTGITQTNTVQPKTTDTFDLGTSARRWNTVRTKLLLADEIRGVLNGNINGNANTSTNLKNVTSFRLSGDVISPAVLFDGQVGSYGKVFNTTLTANIITSRPEPFLNRSRSTDYVLTYRAGSVNTQQIIDGSETYSNINQTSTSGSGVNCRINVLRRKVSGEYNVTILSGGNGYEVADFITYSGISFGGNSPENDIVIRVDEVDAGVVTKFTLMVGQGVSEAVSGLLRQTRDTFVGDLGVPIGSIITYAGTTAPFGYLLCDGSEVERVKYPNLYDTIGDAYSKTFRLATQIQIGQVYTIEILGSTNWQSFMPPIVGDDPPIRVGKVFTATRNSNASDNLGSDNTGVVSTSSFIGVGTFRLPDLRGRFALGRDNMDNSGTVPNNVGVFVDAGGGDINRVAGIEADTLGQGAGSSTSEIQLRNLPEHDHTLQNGNVPYFAVRVDPATNTPATTGLGPSSPGGAQYLASSGPVRKPEGTTLGNPMTVMNPYLTINYIIRSGAPLF
jgi:microcystin-dependent protein